jgi:rare lipoprotein A
MRISALFAIAVCALSGGVAAAEPAPIVYAGQGARSGAGNDLLGGDAHAYGYGASPPAEGPVIDLRRPGTASEAPAPVAVEPGGEAWLERERVGPPYQANGRVYVPTPEPGYAETGQASWYGPQFHGQRGANGEIFDQEAMTAAHPTLPLNSLVQVTNLENGREIIVRVTDRGPFVGERLIDLSHGAATVLGFERAGGARVHVRYLGPAPRRVAVEAAPAAGPASLRPPAAEPQSGTGYLVQVGAFSDRENASRVGAEVAGAGPVNIEVGAGGSGELHRVRLGPFDSAEAAAAAQARLAQLGYANTLLSQP